MSVTQTNTAPVIMLKTPANPGGLPIEVFDQLRSNVLEDRSKFWKELSLPFYGYNRPDAKISEGVRESFWLQSMMCGFPGAYFCIKAFSETDLIEDLKKMDVRTLILHGDDDQIVPIADSALLSVKLVKQATLKIYKARRTACARRTRIRSTRICWHAFNPDPRCLSVTY